MKIIGRIIGVLFFLTFFSWLILFFSFMKYKTGVKTGTNFEEYKANNGVVIEEIPASGTEVKYMLSHSAVKRKDIYVFTLDKEEYDTFVDACIKKYANPIEDKTTSGFWYGMKVSDIDQVTPEYTLDDFPYHLGFQEILDDDVNEYIVIVYHPKCSFTSGLGIIGNPNTGRVVCYSEGSLR